MSYGRVTRVESTLGGGTQYGGEEVVAQAIIAWLYERGNGELRMVIKDKNDKYRRAVITFKKLPRLKKDSKGISSGKVMIQVDMK